MVIARIKSLLGRLHLLLAPPWEQQPGSRPGSRPGSKPSSRPGSPDPSVQGPGMPPAGGAGRRSSSASSSGGLDLGPLSPQRAGPRMTRVSSSGTAAGHAHWQQPATPGSPSKAAAQGALQELSFILRWALGSAAGTARHGLPGMAMSVLG
jgi:hypothetical protein